MHAESRGSMVADGVLRCNIASQIVGGISSVIRMLLRTWCGRGIMLHEIGEGEIISITRVIQIAELDAHRSVSGLKRTSGIRPCIKCRNLMCKDHPSVGQSDWLVDITCKDPSRFDLATDKDIFDTLDMLQSKVDGGENVDKLEKAHGFNHNPFSMYMDKVLRRYVRPVSGIKFDSMHTMYQNGVFTIGATEFLLILRQVGKFHFSHLQR